MGVPLFMQDAKRLFNFIINPCLAPVICRFRANGNHVGKCRICRHLKAIRPDRFAQRARHAKTIKRQNRPCFWFYPESFRIIARIGHGKYARRVGLHQ